MRDYEQDPRYQEGYDPTFNNYYMQQKKPKKKHTGLLAVLVVLAVLTGAVSWAVNVMGLRLNIGEKGAMLTIGQYREEPAAEEPDPAEEPEVPAIQPDPLEQADPDSVLELQQSPQSVENRPAEDEKALSLQEIYVKVSPSTASISCVHRNGSSTGTGIVMTADGYVITNFHVIDEAQQIYVLVEDREPYVATLVGGDETTDIAVLKVEATDLQPAEFGDSDALRVGDTVVAIGDPLGTELRGTMTNGIVSAINRDLNLSGRQMTLIQTNAALNSGNSGGPLINCYGQVVGINTMKMSSYSSTSATVEGLGFAIPITAAKPIIDELIGQGYVSGRPALGIQGDTLDIRAQFFYHLPSGVIITGILEESDAAAQGLAVDDLIVGFNDIPISSLEDLVAAKNDLVAGETVLLTIYRNGKYYQVEVELMDQISPEIY